MYRSLPLALSISLSLPLSPLCRPIALSPLSLSLSLPSHPPLEKLRKKALPHRIKQCYCQWTNALLKITNQVKKIVYIIYVKTLYS